MKCEHGRASDVASVEESRGKLRRVVADDEAR